VKLELWEYPVRDVRWGNTTALADRILTVDRQALVGHLLQDARLSTVDLELCHPGESCRITPVFDVVEPRAKLGNDAGADFPEVLGPARRVGSGATGLLPDVAVSILDPIAGGGITSLLELPGPALPGTERNLTHRYSDRHQLVIVPRVAPDVERAEGLNALRVAVLRAAVYLARAACTGEPARRDVYELGPFEPGLPRIAYVYQMHSHQHPTLPGEPLLYGDNGRHLLPILLHPNEVLDGAVLPGYNSAGMDTLGVQNHAVIMDL